MERKRIGDIKMKRSISPLRYPGGKAKVYDLVVKLLKENSFNGATYIEPLAGGCGLALLLLENNIVNKLILNDIDKGVYCFWQSVLKYNKDFCEMIEKSSISIKERDKKIRIYKNKDNIDISQKKNILELGLATFYLNRVNRSGILKAGVIGGKNQTGNYKMDCRFNKKSLILKIKKIEKLKDKIEFYNYDVIEFIDNYLKFESIDSFVFLDPPYYNKGSELYTNFYKHEDHKRLADYIKKINQRWIVTYDNCEEIKEIFNEYNQKEFDISYTLEVKRKSKEIMIFDKKIEKFF